MSYRRRNALFILLRFPGREARGPADWLGLLALVYAGVQRDPAGAVLDAGVLTTALTVVFILVLVLLNGLHAFVQLPVRCSVAGSWSAPWWPWRCLPP